MVHACGGGQAVNWLDVVLCPQHGIEVRHANRIVALIHAVFGFGQLGLQPGGAGVQAHPEHGLAKNIELYATVTLFSVQAVVIVIVEDRRWHFDLKQRQRAAHATKVCLQADFILFRVNNTGALTVVGSGVRRGFSRLQRFGVVGVKGNLLPRFINHAVGWHPAATVEAVRVVFCTGNFVIPADDHFLMTRPRGEQQLVVQDAQRIAQQPALSTGAPAG